MKYKESYERLKECNSSLCEYIAEVLKKEYIDSEEVRKYIDLCEEMVLRNYDEYDSFDEDVRLKSDEEMHRIIEFYTGISKDKLKEEYIKKKNAINYFSKFNYAELERIIELCQKAIPLRYLNEIDDACDFLQLDIQLNHLEKYVEQCLVSDDYLISQINEYIETNDVKKKILSVD